MLVLYFLSSGFSIGSMIKSGLHFGEYFEMTSSESCGHILYGIRPILHLCFTFIQLYFVFLNSKVCVLMPVMPVNNWTKLRTDNVSLAIWNDFFVGYIILWDSFLSYIPSLRTMRKTSEHETVICKHCKTCWQKGKLRLLISFIQLRLKRYLSIFHMFLYQEIRLFWICINMVKLFILW